MLNLLRKFDRIYIVGDDGQPHRLVPFLGAQEILPPGDNEEVLFPLQLVQPPSVTPNTGTTGAVLTYRPPVYSGSGPIVLTTYVRVAGVVVDPATGQPVTGDPTDFALMGQGPFNYTTRSAQQVQFVTTARGADGILMPAITTTAQISAPPPPAFSQAPSLLPDPAQVGSPVTVNPGAGPNLTWVLLFNGADVRPQMVNGRYTPQTTGTLELRSTIGTTGNTVTQTASVLVTSSTVTPPPNPNPTPTFTMTETGFTVANAGTVEDVQITPTEDGFTVQPN